MFTKARFFKCALQVNPAGYIKYRGQQQTITEDEYNQNLLAASLEAGIEVIGLKWFTEFGHLNRGDMLTSEQHRSHNEKRNFSAEFKRESAQLVVDQNYTVADAASAMDVGLSTMTRWVKQLRDERQGKTPKASPITPEQIEIRELRKKLQRIEMENEILKKATVDSIGQRNSYVKTWGCGGFLNETNIYSRGKSLCF